MKIMSSNVRPRRKISCFTDRTSPTVVVLNCCRLWLGSWASRSASSSSALTVLGRVALTLAWLWFESTGLRESLVLKRSHKTQSSNVLHQRKKKVKTVPKLTWVLNLIHLFFYYDPDSCSHKSLFRNIKNSCWQCSLTLKTLRQSYVATYLLSSLYPIKFPQNCDKNNSL